MLKMIDVFKDNYENKNAAIIGTGPSADKLKGKEKDGVFIGINRAICLSKEFDFIFVDSINTLRDISRFQENTTHILMPLFSVGNNNYNLVEGLKKSSQDKDFLFALNKTRFFVWGHCLPSVLNIDQTGLSDNLLYIDWGNVQSAVHFVKKLGCNELVTFFGVDGGYRKGFSKESANYHCKKVIEEFGRTKQPLKKLDRDYERTKKGLDLLFDKLLLKARFVD